MKRLILLLALCAAAFGFIEENRGIEEEEELFEGDMKLTESQMDALNSRAALHTKKWPGAVVPYQFESSIANEARAKKAISDAFAEYAQKTCVRFRPKTSSDTAYISIFKGSGCWSYVGRTGRMQQISLASGCWRKGTVVHELAHALGFFHEQSRPDRDQYVTIKFENIQSGKEGNFRKHSTSQVTTHNTRYDYGSVMHYSGRAFSKNGQPTIVPKQSNAVLGQRLGLSTIDAQQVNQHYSCAVTPAPPTPPKPTTTSPSGLGFSCNFDRDTCGFVQLKSDKFDWTRRRGGTPSRGTGPNGDHTTGKGYYMYIETSSPRRTNDNAKVEKGGLSFDGNTCVRFYYHMLGRPGSLNVKIGAKRVFRVGGNQGNQWKKADITVRDVGVYPLVFEGVRGSSWRGDIAIDDVRVESCGGVVPPTPPPQTQAPPQGQCGIRPSTRIVGGTTAKQGTWPWQAQLRTTSGFPYCGGSLIGRQWILTATHCVRGKTASSIVIRLGAHKRTSAVGTEQDIKVSKVITHPSYHKPVRYAHDIALLKLVTPARLNKNVNLVCLPESAPAPTDGTRCWITGWGRLASGGATPDILQQASVPIANRARCDQAYPSKIHDSMLCAGLDQGGVDSCQGDSGGPMVCETGGRYYIHGATSWGYGCASPGKFGVYAKVKYLLDWVKSEMAKN